MDRSAFAGLTALSLMLVSGPTFAAGDQEVKDAAPVATATPAAVQREKKYCIVDTVTSSRIPQKTCKTRSEWMREDGFDPLKP